MTLRPQDPRPGERGYPPVTPVEPNTEINRKTSRPRDPQGLLFLTAGDVAADLGITNPANYKHAAYGEVPHYVDTKSGNLDSTSNNRVWFALQDIVNHFAVKSGAGKPVESKSASELAHASRHAYWSGVHQQALKTEEVNKENGINNGDLHNQPDIGNKDIHRRLIYGVRRKTIEGPEFGDRQGTTNSTGSNLDNPVRYGHMVPVAGESSDVIDFSDPRRPRRR
jgi:hypothetical protein